MTLLTTTQAAEQRGIQRNSPEYTPEGAQQLKTEFTESESEQVELDRR